MVTKNTQPIIENSKIIGTKVEYRFFNILLYTKTLIMPEKYGYIEYEYHINI